MATLYLEEEGLTEEVLKKVEPLLQKALEHGHGLSHVLWKDLQLRQESLTSSEEVSDLNQEDLKRLSEEQEIGRVLLEIQYQSRGGGIYGLLQKRKESSKESEIKEAVKPFQKKEMLLKREIASLKEEISTLSTLSPQYKRVTQRLRSLEEKLEKTTQEKTSLIERVFFREESHFNDLLKARQHRFYKKLYESFQDKLDIRNIGVGVIKIFERNNADRISEIVSAIYSYRLQELVPFLTDTSQDQLSKVLSLNFMDFVLEEGIDKSSEDMSLFLSQSFYHQRNTFGERLNGLLGISDILKTVYKEEIPFNLIYRSAILSTSDGAEWWDTTQGSSFEVNNIAVRYHVPYLETRYLKKQEGIELARTIPPSMSLLQREISLPQDSERYFERALRFARDLRAVEERSASRV